MHATRSDVFAQGKSGLGAFLYADVGLETNGSTLTILSVLARLGKDPWTEAARWAALPKSAVIDSLAQSICEMPLAPLALLGARDNAARLVQLLPVKTANFWQGYAGASAAATPQGAPIAIVYFALAVWMAVSVFLISEASFDVQAPIAKSTAAPAATHPIPGLLARQAAVAGPSAAPDRR